MDQKTKKYRVLTAGKTNKQQYKQSSESQQRSLGEIHGDEIKSLRPQSQHFEYIFRMLKAWIYSAPPQPADLTSTLNPCSPSMQVCLTGQRPIQIGWILKLSSNSRRGRPVFSRSLLRVSSQPALYQSLHIINLEAHQWNLEAHQ